MHQLTGKWKIKASTPMGTMALIADFAANEPGTAFTGSVADEGNGKIYEVSNGVIDGNKIAYDMTIRFGLIPFNFHLEGTFAEDGTCKGVGKAMKMEASYEGRKLVG
ncbi:MAG TPA: hypothetical protein PK179_08520 [Spirochaetales bacterium]|nr:hypothetical protein [Spirochaetales bacterium]